MMGANENNDSTLTEPLLVETDVEIIEGVEEDESNHVIAVTDDGAERALLQLDESEWEHGETQTPLCRDVCFAVLFVLQLIVVLSFSGIGIASASSIISKYQGILDTDDDVIPKDYDFGGQDVAFFSLASIGSAVGISAAMLLLLLGPLAKMMIQVTLVMNPVTNLLTAVGFFLYGNTTIALAMLVFCAFSTCYALMVWRRVPFAAANISTAMEALSENKGIFPLSYLVTVVATVWITLWGIALAEIMIERKDWVYASVPCDNDITTDICQRMTPQGYSIIIGLLLNLYWTSQVIGNCFHTTIAGVVGTWWFTADEERPKGCCTSTIYACWVRSNVYSFGSICFGSLVVAILRVMRILVSSARNRSRNSGGDAAASILWCLLECIVKLFERVVEYLNSWAFVYIGLYGYDYVTAGKKVIQLFKSRGWTVIINDNLVSSAFGMLQFWIGVISGAIGAIFGKIFLEATEVGAAFGFVLGILFSSILFSVVNSAVETVVVCFAESPNMLRFNHSPEISNEMIRAWKNVYPDECGW